ncbi:hypothetical protein [Pseudomonas knackmussii]|uniref:hypothetical protein n=1 Tax=Pseudomonas knackmussii TaxID=65741 RepID=UPI003F4A145D
MDLFRAIPFSQLDKAEKGQRRYSTVRIPNNVPYLVDNLWEWLRPQSMPSRRYAIYASPTPELALANASAPLGDGEHYIACRVIVDPEHLRIAQLSVSDAREHPDIRAVARWVGSHGQALTALELVEKQRVAPLFMPGLGREELEHLRLAHSLVAEICHYVQEVSTFWSAAAKPVASSEGELFFELTDSSITYRLEPV